MSFDLRIHFTGLCLFAPDFASPGSDPQSRLYVLLLKHQHDPHHPRLIYDRAYETQGSSDVEGHLCCPDLADRAIWFAEIGTPIDEEEGFGHPDVPGKLPEGIVDLHTIAGVEMLGREFVGPRPIPDNEIAARVTVFDGSLGKIPRGARWKIPNRPQSISPRRISFVLQWIVADIDADHIDVDLRNLRETDEPIIETITLFPIPDKKGKNTVDLWIYNALWEDLPPATGKDPVPGQDADHFGAYYLPFEQGNHVVPKLIKAPITPKPDPVTSECKPAVSPEFETHGHRLVPRTAHTATCIMAQAALDGSGGG